MCVGVHPLSPNPARGYFYAGLVFTALSSVLFLDASKPNPQLLSAITFELSFPSLILPSTSFLAPGTNICWWSDQRSPSRPQFSTSAHLYVAGVLYPPPSIDHHSCSG